MVFHRVQDELVGGGVGSGLEGKGVGGKVNGKGMGSPFTSSAGGKLCRFRPGKYRIPPVWGLT